MRAAHGGAQGRALVTANAPAGLGRLAAKGDRRAGPYLLARPAVCRYE